MVMGRIAKAWYDENPELLEELRKRVAREYSDLAFYRDEDELFIRGVFPVSYNEEILEKYEIEILVPKDKEEVPLVWETGGRIPRHEDNHVNPLGGELCLFVPDEAWIHYPPGSDILDLLKGPVRNFFIGVSLHLRGQPWPFGERSHGVPGIVESYADVLGTTDTGSIRRYLDLLSRANIKGHWTCPCGSGEKIRKCHGELIRDLHSKIPAKVAKKSLQRLDNQS
jgi:hypothetical protein